MTQEQIRKHGEEMKRWAEAPDRTKVWHKMKAADSWALDGAPAWLHDILYIVDDEWAELRKAQIDGKQLQIKLDGEWVDADLSDGYLPEVVTPDRWRIKPEVEFPVYRRHIVSNCIVRFNCPDAYEIMIADDESLVGTMVTTTETCSIEEIWKEVPTATIDGETYYDTQPVWVWFDDCVASRAVRFVDAKNNGLFKENGMRGGLGQHNIAPIENIDDWMAKAWQRLLR